MEFIESFLSEKLNPSFIVLFGSMANETSRPDSDIDLAFYPNEKHAATSAYELFLIAQELADHLKREVDLINIRTASTVFQAQIYGTGILLHAQNKAFYQQQRMTALSMYARLNEERKPVLDKIKESGSIYES
nr:nucleotidyltransferase domain-containing protein [Shouchella xiaoxiensis]